MNEEEMKFLASVRTYASQGGEQLQRVLSAAISGITERTDKIRAHAVDMEVVASMALNQRLFKGNEKFIADKLESWKNFNGLRWDDQIERLRK